MSPSTSSTTRAERAAARARAIRPRGRGGFTLLELLVAFALLTTFILPVLQLVHEARVRAFKYTLKREVQDLAQRKLFERVYYYSEETVLAGQLQAMSGTFAEEGHPDWEWEIPYPEVVSQGEQVLLEYRIRLFVPQLGERQLDDLQSEAQGGMPWSNSSRQSHGFEYAFDRPASYELTTWTFPSEYWYEEQEELQALGVETGYYPGGF